MTYTPPLLVNDSDDYMLPCPFRGCTQGDGHRHQTPGTQVVQGVATPPEGGYVTDWLNARKVTR